MSYLTNEIDRSFWLLVKKAVEKDSQDGMYIALQFLSRLCRKSIVYKQIVFFQKYISFVPNIYSLLFNTMKQGSANNLLYRNYAEHMSFYLKQIIGYEIQIEAKGTTSTEQRKEINEFYYEAFNSFSALFFNIIWNQDWTTLEKSIQNYKQISSGAFASTIQQRVRLNTLQHNADNHENSHEIRLLAEEITTRDKFNDYKRQTVNGIRYWLFLLFNEEVIDNKILAQLSLTTDFLNYDITTELKDVLEFSQGKRDYMGWENWDYMERAVGEGYSPPMAINWITEGFFLNQLYRGEGIIDTDNLSTAELRNVSQLYPSFKEAANRLKMLSEKWAPILKNGDQDSFKHSIESLLERLSEINQRSVGYKDRALANIPLSEPEILSFQKATGAAWKKEARIRQLFNHFGNAVDYTGNSILLQQVGTHNFFERAKIAFVDGQYYQKIYGLQDLGANVGRWEDTLFFQRILDSNFIPSSAPSALELIETSISKLKANGVEPTAILLEPEYAYKDERLTNDPRYKPIYQSELHNEEISFIMMGLFDEIPLYTSYSPLIKNRILVSNFEQSFELRYKTDTGWYDSLFEVSVEEVSDDLARQKIREQPEKWTRTDEGSELNEEDAIILAKTSVIIDLGTIIDYHIKDPSKFILGQIMNAPSD